MNAPMPPGYPPPRPPSVMLWLLKAFALGICLFVCIGLFAGVMAQHELSGTQVLVTFLVVWWTAVALFVARAVRNARRGTAARIQAAQQYQQWQLAMQQAEWEARQRAAYDAEMQRQRMQS